MEPPDVGVRRYGESSGVRSIRYSWRAALPVDSGILTYERILPRSMRRYVTFRPAVISDDLGWATAIIK